MLTFAPREHDEIRRHGEDRYPDEACGVLLGRRVGQELRATRVVRCDAAPARRDRYEIDAAVVARLERAARDRGEEILGFYHSHPDGPAAPSRADLDEAEWPGYAYVITSIRAGRAEQTRAFVLSSGTEGRRFVEERIEVRRRDEALGAG